jgi:hypothetical protein
MDLGGNCMVAGKWGVARK